MSTEVRFSVPDHPWVVVKNFSRVPVEGELVEWRERLFRVHHVLWTDEYGFGIQAVLDLEEAEDR